MFPGGVSPSVVPDKFKGTYRAKKTYDRFCDSSSIHGVCYWKETKSYVGKLIWMSVVFTGLCASYFVIDNSFEKMAESPFLTSVVKQKVSPIEAVEFPSITICPLERNR